MNQKIRQVIQQIATGRSLVLLDQAIVSGGNFVLGILLARLLGLDQFGLYSLLWMGVLFSLSIHQAFFSQPLYSLFAGKADEEKEGYLRDLFELQIIVSVGLALLPYLVFHLLQFTGLSSEWLVYLPITGAIAGAYLLQDFLRKIFFVRNIYTRPFAMDVLLYSTMIGGLLAFEYLGQLTLTTALYTILAAYTLSAVLYAFKTGITAAIFTRKQKGESFFTSSTKTGKEHYHYSIWLLGTSLMQWFSGNFFLLAAASILGTMAVGALRMAQNIIGLCHVLFLAMENIVPAEAAQHFFEKGHQQMYAYLRSISLKMGAVVLALLAGLTLIAPWLIELLYGKEYLPYSYLVGAYAFLYVFVFLGHPMRYALRTIQYTQPIFIAYCVSAAISVVAAFPITRSFSMQGVMAGLIGTQIIMLGVYAYFIVKKRAIHASLAE